MVRRLCPKTGPVSRGGHFRRQRDSSEVVGGHATFQKCLAFHTGVCTKWLESKTARPCRANRPRNDGPSAPHSYNPRMARDRTAGRAHPLQEFP